MDPLGPISVLKSETGTRTGNMTIPGRQQGALARIGVVVNPARRAALPGTLRISRLCREWRRCTPIERLLPHAFCGGEGGRRPDEGASDYRGAVEQGAHRMIANVLQRPPSSAFGTFSPRKSPGGEGARRKEVAGVSEKERLRRASEAPKSQRKINLPVAAPSVRITITKPVTFTQEPRIVSARRNVPDSTDNARKCQGPQTHSFLAAACANPPRIPVEIADLWFTVKGARCSLSARRR